MIAATTTQRPHNIPGTSCAGDPEPLGLIPGPTDVLPAGTELGAAVVNGGGYVWGVVGTEHPAMGLPEESYEVELWLHR